MLSRGLSPGINKVLRILQRRQTWNCLPTILEITYNLNIQKNATRIKNCEQNRDTTLETKIEGSGNLQ